MKRTIKENREMGKIETKSERCEAAIKTCRGQNYFV